MLQALAKRGTSFSRWSFWQSTLFSDPRGTTNAVLRVTNRCALYLKGYFFFMQKRSTPFHKEILPTFTKQLRKNYTIIVPFSSTCKYIHKKIIKQNKKVFLLRFCTFYQLFSVFGQQNHNNEKAIRSAQPVFLEMPCNIEHEIYLSNKNKKRTETETSRIATDRQRTAE